MANGSVLITGGMGLIGSYLAGALAAGGRDVVVLGRSQRYAVPDAVPAGASERIRLVNGDVSDPEILEELLKECEVVFHKPSSVGLAGAAESARDYVGQNLIGTATLVDVLRKKTHNVKQVVLGSSIAVYGEGCYNCKNCGVVRPRVRVGAIETANWNPPCPRCGGAIEPTLTDEVAQQNGESVYAVTRKSQEDLLIGTCRLLGVPLKILRYSTVLGPGQSWHNPFTGVLEMLASGEAPTIHEDGRQTRDFIFIQDLVRANELVLEHQGDLIEAFNVSAIHLPLKDFIQELAKTMAGALGQKPVEPTIDGKLISGDVRHCWVDCTKLERLSNSQFKPEQKLETGLHALVEWFAQHKGLTAKKRSAIG